MKPRIGFGFDVHRLEAGRELWLGGIKIEHTKGAVGHSDADVIIHAICDALLGAAALGDIGTHFPDTSNEFKGIDSKILLKKTCELLASKKYSIGNIDITLALEKPKIKPYVAQIRETLAMVMNISVDDISIKAGTNEKMGYIGREEGVSAYAVVMIWKNAD